MEVGGRSARTAVEHKGDRAVTVGFGYPDSHWKTIEAHDSIGLNFFLLHDHVPTYYVMEKVLSNHRALLEIRAEAHDGVPLILGSQIGNLHLGRLKFRLDNTAKLSRRIIDRIYYSYDLLPPGHKEHQMVKAYELMNRLGLFKVKRRFRMLTKRRGSVAQLINLAVRIGYQHIVLCGVDLNHSEYFYDPLREELESKGFPVPPNTQPTDIHDTNDPGKIEVTIKQVIMAINDLVLQPRGISLYCGDKSSDLYPYLDEYPWAAHLVADSDA